MSVCFAHYSFGLIFAAGSAWFLCSITFHAQKRAMCPARKKPETAQAISGRYVGYAPLAGRVSLSAFRARG